MKKRHIFLHIGLPKTGSSALQECLTINAKALADQGISYPFPESLGTISSGVCTGNMVHIIERKGVPTFQNGVNRTDLVWFEQIIGKGLAEADCDKVLFSSEAISNLDFDKASDILRKLERENRVTLVAYVRDPYDQAISAWKQRVKTGKSHHSLSERIALIVSGQSDRVTMNVARYITTGFDVRIINYDVHRKDIFAPMLREMGIDAAKFQRVHPKDRLSNPSVSYRQASQIITTNKHIGSSVLKALLIKRFRAQTDPIKDPYFREVDRILLDYLSGAIATLNGKLPADEQLRNHPRDYDQTSDDTYRLEDLTPLFETIREAMEMELNRPKFVPNKALPTGFDPLVYLLLNPDVEAAGVDPVKHYLSNGRYEGRKYS
ncbi:hypothetical protein [Yoonia sp. I 8.24]|uniref:hypothetical protein n=1 Tax=Yoonia sp. I 8.24 TaxID=1537229 RepID=UPI001EE02A7F|nr:hypothetical protein [Yoonia sp. I 8.24]MCG3267396.1 STAS/SEC14 domain-containing protein [Yoonia sp. I 8.24]